MVLIGLLLGLCATGYWVKCQIGLNFMQSVSISEYFPFNYIADNVLLVDEPGTVLYESFDDFRIFSQLTAASFRDRHLFYQKIVENGFGDNSRGLEVSYQGVDYWVLSFAKYISVRKGDVFQLDGATYLENEGRFVCMRVVSYDADKNAIDWQMVKQGVWKKNAWVKVGRKFTITDNKIRYIQFQIMGRPGVYLLDNLSLSKLKSGPAS